MEEKWYPLKDWPGYEISEDVCYAEDVDFLRRNIDNIRGLDGQKKRVKAINLETGEERIYSSRQQASRDLGIPDSYISNIIAGRSHKTRGWTFEDMPIILEKKVMLWSSLILFLVMNSRT